MNKAPLQPRGRCHAAHAQAGAGGQEAAGSILVLTAPTGAGHDSTAQALAEALSAALPGVPLRVCALLGGRRGALGVGWWYDVVAAHAPRLWALFYHLTDRECIVRLGTALMALAWGRRLKASLRREKPRLVLSVHPLCARLAAHVLRGEHGAPPHHCVVTDLVTVHRSWACAEVARFYVATPHAAAALRRSGIPPQRIRVTGLPVRRAFTIPPAPSPRGDLPVVLLLGGRRPSCAFRRAARALLAPGLPLRPVVVCGGSRLRQRLARRGGGRAVVLGWQRDVAALMRAADIVVTKAGSATLAEALSQARPVLVYQALGGQEEGNVGLLERENLGRYVSDADALPAAVGSVLARHDPCRARERAAWWSAAAGRVAADVAALLEVARERARSIQ